MVVVLEQFPQHKEVHQQTVFGFVMVIEIGVAVLVATPVDNGAMHRAHHKVKRQQKIHPPVGSWKLKNMDAQDIDQYIDQSPAHPHHHGIREQIEFIPIRHIFGEAFFGFDPKTEVVIINVPCLPHHGKEVLRVMRAMGIFWGVAVGVVHPVKDRIGPGGKIRTALADPGKQIKEFLPEPAHLKHLMGGISVQEKTLAKQREIPVEKEEGEYNHGSIFWFIISKDNPYILYVGMFFVISSRVPLITVLNYAL